MLQQYIMGGRLTFPAKQHQQKFLVQFRERKNHIGFTSKICVLFVIGKTYIRFTLITVQFEYASGDQGFGLNSRLGIPLGTSLAGMYDTAVHTSTISGTP